jgi:hypothetical protein
MVIEKTIDEQAKAIADYDTFAADPTAGLS